MKIFVLLLVAVLYWSACMHLDLNDQGNTCDFSEDFRRTLPAENVSIIRVNATAGKLFIRQHDGDELEIHAFACASSPSDLDKINLVTTVDSTEIKISADLSQVRNNGSLDLNMQVPRNAQLIITDSSGDILIENINNDIYLDDGSGTIQIYNIDGLVNVIDGSGNIAINNIQANVTIQSDGSGNINISQVAGDVTIGADGSGNIAVSNINGDFSLGQDGSGSVNYANIGGQVYLP